ncbi:MAG: hypothetical protein FWH18_01890 [Marinilabiliaceae bacterium]|nr:hypothetical protein [Marinilabiliaceae bacterium]
MRSILLIFTVLVGFNLSAQKTSKLIHTAKGEMQKENYVKAVNILEPLTNQKPVDKEALKLTGECFLNISGEEEKAMRYLEKAAGLYPLGKNPNLATLETHFYLAQALHMNYRFDQAMAIYENLLNFAKQRELVSAINREINYVNNAIEMVKTPLEFKIISLGSKVNSPFDEHSPLVAADETELYFTSNRPLKGAKKDETEYFENIYVSYWLNDDWGEAEPLKLRGNYFGNRATVSLSADGNTMIIFQNDGFSGSLFETRKTFRGWTEPKPLAINSTNFNETHACYSPDGNELWFTSDRPGGYGGKDIYISHKLPDGSWGPPVNAGPEINTEWDEEAPFISPDGSQLFFASEGHSSMGGFDVFMCKKNEDETWSKPENIGYPINTTNDDIFYLPTPDGQRVYYSSRRVGSMGGTDLYMLVFPDDDARALAVLAGYVFYGIDEPGSDAVITITDENKKLYGIYRPNQLTGKYVAILPTGIKYFLEIESDGYKTFTKEVNIPIRNVFGTRQTATFTPNIFMEIEDVVETEEVDDTGQQPEPESN